MRKACFKIFVSVLAVIMLSAREAKPQTAADSARTALELIYQSYDSIPYLTFDVKYTYFSDTVYSDYSYEVLTDTYTMGGTKARYTLGNTEYLQNDSLCLAVFHDDQMIVVRDPVVSNAGSFLPQRQTLDSILQAYSDHYVFTIKTTMSGASDTLGYIRMDRIPGDTIAVFNKYTIDFSLADYLIYKIAYDFTEPGEDLSPEEEPDDGERLLRNSDRHRLLIINFSGYRFDNFSSDAYNEDNFIWLENGEYRPVEKYKYYSVFNARN